MMLVDMKAHRFFFDRVQVYNRIGKAKARSLGYMGRDVRQAGRKLLGKKRKRGGVSAPGNPPFVHTDDERATLRNIQYHSDGESNVIVGPVKLNQFNQVWQETGSITVPELMEKGGVVGIREVSYDQGKKWFRFDQRRNVRPGETHRVRRAQYQPRPFMGPALRKSMERWQAKGKYPGLTVGPESAVQIGPAAA